MNLSFRALEANIGTDNEGVVPDENGNEAPRNRTITRPAEPAPKPKKLRVNQEEKLR